MFRHPNYYKELRKRNKLAESRQPVVGGQQQSDQVISSEVRDGARERASWSGPQASSFKHQASSFRTNLFKHQATSVKPQAASFKRQATSGKLPDSRSTVHGY